MWVRTTFKLLWLISDFLFALWRRAFRLVTIDGRTFRLEVRNREERPIPVIFRSRTSALEYIFLIIVYSFFINTANADTIKVTTYNILKFPEALAMQRVDDLRIVIEYMKPDVLVVQEIQSQMGVNLFLDSVLNYTNNRFNAVPFHDGPDTDNALFYDKNKIEFLAASYLSTSNRDIAEYRLKVKESTREFFIFSLHFKASQGTGNESIRFQEATVLRNHLDLLTAEDNFLVLGDFNIYQSDEPAYNKLTGYNTNNIGRLFDPLSMSGDWHKNVDFAFIHTQSTRTERLEDGGAGGGLDDRFDMILCSRSLLDSSTLYITRDSYKICGNDGNHFGSSVNYGFNQSVPDEVADALYFGSDHLPVSINIIDGVEQTTPEKFVKIWPNPMHRKTHIEFPWFDEFQGARVSVTNILGQRVYESQVQDPAGCTLQRGKLPVGIYFVHVEIETKYNQYNFRTKLAVIQ
jgi:endonuclease/exonuclease/phosphatase family metal-dependent hydrolase